MDHINEDQILKFVLELLEDEENTIVNEHISNCLECREEYKKILSDIDELKSLRPEIPVPAFNLPAKKNRKFMKIVRVAAVLLIGFSLGYVTSANTKSCEVNVVGQYTIAKAPDHDFGRAVFCDGIDTDLGSY